MSNIVDVPALPEGIHPELALMIAQLDEGTKEWLGELPTDLTEEEIAWQPFEGGHSIGAVLVHIAEVEGFWLHFVACGEPYHDLEQEMLGAVVDQDNVKWPTPPAGRPLSFYTDPIHKNRARTKALLAGKNDPEEKVPFKDREFTLRWLLTHVIGHESYHGGQAALLALMQRKKNV